MPALVATLGALARSKRIPSTTVVRAIAKYGIDGDAANPSGR